MYRDGIIPTFTKESNQIPSIKPFKTNQNHEKSNRLDRNFWPLRIHVL
jgi:hypothetical protein